MKRMCIIVHVLPCLYIVFFLKSQGIVLAQLFYTFDLT